jgi:hypothetical protein
MKRQSKVLSDRKPGVSSLSCSLSFSNTNNLFNNLEDVCKHFGPVSPERIWNTD